MSCLERLAPLTDVTILKAPSAPGLWVSFGTWRGAEGFPEPIAPHSAGKGVSRDRAVLACLGEMAESLSIGAAAHQGRALTVIPVAGAPFTPSRPEILVPMPRAPNDVGSEGAAAGESLEEAIASARAEKIERIARRSWWQDTEEARPLAHDWLQQNGVRAFEASLRGGAGAERRSAFFTMPSEAGLCTILAITEGAAGRSMGTAAAETPVMAARKALEEAILEEIPLLTASGKPASALVGEEAGALERSESLVAKLERAGRAAPVIPVCAPEDSPETRMVACDLTLKSVGVPVARCAVSIAPAADG